MIVVDTSLLSVVLRRRPAITEATPHAEALRQMILAGVPPHVPGIVFQEVLSGVKTDAQFTELAGALRPLPILLSETSDHLLAATLFNTCQRKGVATTLVDCLIAAQTISNGAHLWTLDHDFVRIAQRSDLQLFTPR